MHLLPKSYTNVNELVRKKGLHITSFSVSYENIMSFFTIHISSDMDYLWHAAGLFSTPAEPSLNWICFMQDLTKGIHPPRTDIDVLPVIDLKPSEETCIYSSLLFVIEQSKKLSVTTPSITFDQRLWLKALEIITANKLDTVSFLGCFHMWMSFYGSTVTIMAGSWIDKLFQNIYGENSVKHILFRWGSCFKTFLQKVHYWLIKLQQIALSECIDSTNNVNLKVI